MLSEKIYTLLYSTLLYFVATVSLSSAQATWTKAKRHQVPPVTTTERYFWDFSLKNTPD
jgi:hypothetical protein